MDDAIRRRRAAGATWVAIAAELGLSAWCVNQRAQKLGLTTGRLAAAPEPEAPQPTPGAILRPPLPAGHPDTWGLLSSDPYP